MKNPLQILFLILRKQPCICLLIIFIHLLILAQNAHAVEEKFPEVTIRNTESFTIYSENTYTEYKIYVALPLGYDESDTIYPVLYGMDADIGFGFVTDIFRLLQFVKEVPEFIIVGIAYGALPFEQGNHRTRDYTPTAIDEWPNSGGADQYIAFIREELFPFIDSLYRTDPTDRTLRGASLGGLFSLYVLFFQTELFQRYIVGSPSLWCDEQLILKMEEKYSRERTTLPVRLFLSVGSLEDQDGMIKPLLNLSETIQSRNYTGLKMEMAIIEGETHYSAQAAAAVKGIKFVFKND